jgi:4-azaleucine resistance transporter AzlC
MISKRSEFFAGLRAQIPLLFGVIPFGLIYGAVAINAGLEPAAVLAMSLIVFAGSAQFIAAGLFGTGTPGIIIVLTTLVVNLRHMLYSASLAPYLRHLPMRWKAPLAFLLTDEAYAVIISRYQADEEGSELTPNRHWFFLGAGLTLWVTWQISTVVGIFAGQWAPLEWSLDFTLPLTFIALVVPMLVDSPSALVVLVAGVVALVCVGLPYNLGLMVAVSAGIAAGTLLEGRAAHVQPVRERDTQ